MVLTDKYVGHQSGRQTEHDDEDISDRQVHDEEVGDSSHPRRAVHHGYHETVPDKSDEKHEQVRGAVHCRHRAPVPVHHLVGDHLQVGPVQRHVHPQRVVPVHGAVHVRRQRLQVRQHAVVRHELTVHRLHDGVGQNVHHVVLVALPHVRVVVVAPVVPRLLSVCRKIIRSILTHEITRRNP